MTAPELLARVAEGLEPVLSGLLEDTRIPPNLVAAMRHATLGAGKRLRPALLIAAAQATGRRDALPVLLPAAAGVELIHCYSLVHDDLPAMDDAELRRGRPSCHRAFGEATAILAGDALQALAFEALARPLPGVAPAAQLEAVRRLAAAGGAAGMCGGQALDLAAERVAPDDAGLLRLQAMKTGALIAAAVTIGGCVGGAGPRELAALEAFGRALGRAFQITDDVLDVIGGDATTGKPQGADARAGKPTSAARFGLEGARELAARAARQAEEALEGLGGAAELRQLARFAVERDH